MRLIKPPRGVFFCSGNGQGNATITALAGEGEYFDPGFAQDDYFEYAIENKTLHLAESGVGVIVNLSAGIGVFSRSVDKSTNNDQPVNMPEGTLFSMILKTSDGRSVTEDPLTGTVTNPTAISRTVHVPDLETLRTNPIPDADGALFLVAGGLDTTDGRGDTIWEWKSASVAAYTDPNTDLDCSVIKSANSLNGRYLLRLNALRVGEVDAGSRITGAVCRDSVTKGLISRRYINSGGAATDKIVPEVENCYQGSFGTIAELLAKDSTVWNDGDWVKLRGITVDGDLTSELRVYWDAADAENDANILGTYKWRPDDLAGVAPGRWVAQTATRSIKFADADETPDVSGCEDFYCADAPPAAGITTFDKMRNGKIIRINPGAAVCTFVNSATFKCPDGENYPLQPGAPFIWAFKDNDVIYISAQRPQLEWFEDVVAGSTITIDKLVFNKARTLVIVGNGERIKHAAYNIAANVATGQTVFTFAPALADGLDIAIQA